MRNIIVYAIAVLILLVYLFIIYKTKKHDEEKFLFITCLFYAFISASYLNFIPTGFIICMFVIITHVDSKNRKIKAVSSVLGFLPCVILTLMDKFL